jgi:hypothetical protein
MFKIKGTVMNLREIVAATLIASPLIVTSTLVQADENTFGLIKGAEVLPKGACLANSK